MWYDLTFQSASADTKIQFHKKTGEVDFHELFQADWKDPVTSAFQNITCSAEGSALFGGVI